MQPQDTSTPTDAGQHSFDYLLVLVSVIVGLALTHLLIGVAKIILDIDKIYVPHLMWATTVFILLMQFWWSFWEFKIINFTYTWYIIVLLSISCLSIMSNLLFMTGGNKFETHFENIHRPFFITLLIYLISAFFGMRKMRRIPFFHLSNAFRFGGMIMAIFGAIFYDYYFNILLASLALIQTIAFLTKFPRYDSHSDRP